VLAGRFARGELVRVRGRVERFREQLQIELRSIARADGVAADPARFLPVAYRDLDELEGFLEHLAREVYDGPLQLLLEQLLGNQPLREQLRRAPCSIPAPRAESAPRGAGGAGRATAHHAYLGGLLEHTVAVATLALELCTLHPRLDRDLLLTAAIVHDLGKTREFTYGAEIARSPQGKLLGHIELGLRVLAAHVPASLDDERRLALEHCVILHHGGDGGAGQRFASAEALALYRLNALDAHVKGVLERGGP
jgi:3'-5' exoribonuclease